MNDEQWKALTKPFPPGTVGKLPKPYKKDSPKAQCRECGGYHGLPAVHLDYVGHAAVTDRLLSTDREWTWEPLGLDQNGLPALDRDGNLWIKLTVAGVTRIGVGDGASMKERIGDALRNAAMRFGVALDLWSKEELESGLVAEVGHEKQPIEESPRDTILAFHHGDFSAAITHAHGLGFDNLKDPDQLTRYAAELRKVQP